MSPARRRRQPGRYVKPRPAAGDWVGTRAKPRLTFHACARMEEMGVTLQQVAAILTDPEVEYGTGGWSGFTAQRGELAVGFADDPETGIEVLTVLYRTQDQYQRAR